MFAIVTAGDSAIGRHLVTALCGAGYRVAFTHFGAATAAARVEADAAAQGGMAKGWDCDAGDEAAVQAFHSAAASWAGG